MRPNKSGLKIALAVAIPCLLFLVIRERLTWRPRTLRYDAPITAIAYSPNNGKWLAVARQAQLEIRVVQTDRILWSETFHQGLCKALAWSPNGRTLAIMRRSRIQLWDVAAHRVVREMRSDGWYPGTAILFSADGSQLLTGGGEIPTLLWDVKTGKLLKEVAQWTVGTPVAMSPDGHTLALLDYVHYPTRVRLWRWGTWQEQHILVPPGGDALTCVAFAPDSKTAATGTESGRVIFWDVGTGDRSYSATFHYGGVECLAFTHNGQWLATGGGEGDTKLWDAQQHTLLRTLSDHSGAVFALTINPDATQLAAASQKNLVKLWRVR